MREDPWLSERLGRPAFTLGDGDITLPQGPAFVQAKVPCDDLRRVAELERLGLRVVDVNVKLRRPAAASGRSSTGVRFATPADREDALDIAEHHYAVSRFHLDPAIADDDARSIKREWLANFFAGRRGDQLLVAEVAGRVMGFHLVLDTSPSWTIDLIAVHGEARRSNVGTALVAALLDTAPRRDVFVGTQVSNTSALNFYLRLGFSVAGSQYVLHGHPGAEST